MRCCHEGVKAHIAVKTRQLRMHCARPEACDCNSKGDGFHLIASHSSTDFCPAGSDAEAFLMQPHSREVADAWTGVRRAILSGALWAAGGLAALRAPNPD